MRCECDAKGRQHTLSTPLGGFIFFAFCFNFRVNDKYGFVGEDDNGMRCERKPSLCKGRWHTKCDGRVVANLRKQLNYCFA